MRYTTIIDQSELPSYRSTSARLLYLHLVLKSGYHRDNQDLVHTSLRRMAAEVGLSLAAVRHALGLLLADSLVTMEAPRTIRVTKFVQPVMAAKRTATTLTDGSTQTAAHDERKRQLTDELEKLRRWYRDAEARQDTASMSEIKATAAKVKKQLTAL